MKLTTAVTLPAGADGAAAAAQTLAVPRPQAQGFAPLPRCRRIPGFTRPASPTLTAALLALGLWAIPNWAQAPAGSALLTAAALLVAWRETRQGRRMHQLRLIHALQQARQRERERLALNLHDSVIQPYIGLRLALDALRMQAAAGLPIGPGLERVCAMCSSAIADLRRCTDELEQPQTEAAPLLAQIEQQARQLRQFHGVDITVRVSGPTDFGAHLCTEVLHLVREGLSNICRHTQARSGQVRLDCDGRWLKICIANEGLPAGGSFIPRSISRRAAALGGRALVRTEAGGQTAVHIQLPL